VSFTSASCLCVCNSILTKEEEDHFASFSTIEKSKSLGSGGSMVARLKLKGIDGRAPPGVEPAA